MARARNIKPGFYKNEDLAECSIWARFIFPGLWMLADREGRLEDRPKRIKAELLAFDSVEIDPLLDELQARGFLERYENEDGKFIQISKFSVHQTPHYSEKGSVIKPPTLRECLCHQDTDIPRVLQEDSKKLPTMKRGSQPPDSLNPDSLNPESLKQPLSTLPEAKIDAGPPAQQAEILEPPEKPPSMRLNGKAAMVEEVMAYLNHQARRGYMVRNPRGSPTSNAEIIAQRLREGYTVQQLKDVVGFKSNEWMGDEKMDKYLNPKTLFRKSNFENYLAEAEAQA